MLQHTTVHPSGLKSYENGSDLEAAATAIPVTLPALWGIPLKYLSLIALAVQNSTLTILMHHSRVSTPPSKTYSAATAVLMSEIFKGVISMVIVFTRVDLFSTSFETSPTPFSSSQRNPTKTFVYRMRRIWREILSPDCWKLSIPAILYVVQNNLQYVAASNLPAATFQVTYQMKILTTAVFSVALLHKKITSSQWLALFCLAIGVGIVQIQAGAHDDPSLQLGQPLGLHSMNALKGFMAVAAACLTSGLAGVYFEKVLKNSQADLWVRNVQLSLFSILPALAPVILARNSEAAHSAGGLMVLLFRNFGGWAWATVAVQVLGGLLTAMVIKYSDNILKGFATSLSIVISFLASVALFHFRMSLPFAVGSAIVLVATWLYNQSPTRPTHPSNDSQSWNRIKNEKAKDDTTSPISSSSSLSTLSMSLTTTASSPMSDSVGSTYLR